MNDAARIHMSQGTEAHILLVDDHAVVRSGIRQLLSSAGKHYLLGEAGNAQEALQQLREGDWDMVLLDINLPGQNGLELLKRIRKEWPEVPVLILSMHSEEQYALRTIRAGAAGYLNKNGSLQELVDAIEQVATNQRPFITPQVAERMATEMAADTTAELHQRLSDREFHVFRLIASGMRVSEIAEDMALSVKTINTYRSRILTKMGMKTNAELMRYALTHGIV
jgi:two-component system invasion response regulator UvrY